LNALAQYGYPIHQWAVQQRNDALPGRCGALARDLTTYTDHLRDGLRMALSLGSRQRYDEAVEIYRKAPEPWLKEPAKGLAKDFSENFR
jgi:hypothetical protein